MILNLELAPDDEARLRDAAGAAGMNPERYIQLLVEREFTGLAVNDVPHGESGMALENGVLVYRTGRPLPGHVVDSALRCSGGQTWENLPGFLTEDLDEPADSLPEPVEDFEIP